MARALLLSMAGAFVLAGAEIRVAQVANTVTAVSAELTVEFLPAGDLVTAIQFDLEHDPGLTISMSEGTSATIAGKGLYTFRLEQTRMRVVLVGLNRLPMPPGNLLSLRVERTSEAGTASSPMRLGSLAASDEAGRDVPVTGSAGEVQFGPGQQLPLLGLFPHVAAGGGWKTSFTLLNLTSSPLPAQIRLLGGDGTPWSVPLKVLENEMRAVEAASVDLIVPANGVALVETSNLNGSPAQVGWAQVFAAEGLYGAASFALQKQDSPGGDTPVPLETRIAKSFLIPFNNTAGKGTGLALVNGSDSSVANVIALFRDASGRTLFTDVLTLPPLGHVAFSLTERYSTLLDNWGTVEMRESRGGRIALIGLKFNADGSFSSIPATAR